MFKSVFGCIFNRKSIRVSYCTIRDMARLISGHNGKLAADSTEQPAALNTEPLPPNDLADTPAAQLDPKPSDGDGDGSSAE